MSTPTDSSSTTSPTTDPTPDYISGYTTFLHTASLSLLVLSPILIALPPRKLDLYTFSLVGAFSWSGNHLLRERTGLGVLGHLGARRRHQQDEQEQYPGLTGGLPAAAYGRGRLLDEAPRAHGAGGISGAVREDWKAERLKEEQEKLDQGEGYGDMIKDQIWDVWTWGQGKVEEVKDRDEKVVREKRREEEFPRIGKGG